MTKINNAFNWFFQPSEFQKLSNGKKWAVGIVSFIPAITLVGIIASPFIWKGMVSALSKKKITPEGGSNLDSETRKIFERNKNHPLAKGNFSAPVKVAVPKDTNQDRDSSTSSEASDSSAESATTSNEDIKTGKKTLSNSPVLDAETLKTLETLQDVIYPHGTKLNLERGQMALLEEDVPKDMPITYTLFYKPETGNLAWKTKFSASPSMIDEINKFIEETERKGQVAELKAAGIQFLPSSFTANPGELMNDGDFIIYGDGLWNLQIFANVNGKYITSKQGTVKDDEDLFKKLKSFNLWPRAT